MIDRIERAGACVGRAIACFVTAWVFTQWGWYGVAGIAAVELCFASWHLYRASSEATP